MSGDYSLFCTTCQKSLGVTDYHLRTLVLAIEYAETLTDLAETFSGLPDESGFDLIAPWHQQSSLRIAGFRGHKSHTLIVHTDDGNPCDLTRERAQLAADRAEHLAREGANSVTPGHEP